MFGPVRLLALLTLMLAAGLGWLWLDQYAHLRNITWAAPAALPPDIQMPVRAPLSKFTASDAAQFATILERPLFAPDRRPPPPPAALPPPDPMADIQIFGIVSGANSGILARVDGKLSRVKLNQSIGSWTLKTISGRDITFRKGDETRTLHLAYVNLGSATPQSTTATPPSGKLPENATSSPPTVIRPNTEELGRENIRRRNVLRAARGLPLITE